MSAIARAVLYEGYLLWPYRPSAPKNRQRWTFGAVLPPAWCAGHPDDRSSLRCQCLVESEAPEVTAVVRFLQVVRRADWEEAVEREVAPGPLAFAAGSAGERSWEALRGTVEQRTERLGPRLARVTVRVENTTPWAGADRQEALRHALVSTHVALRAEGGSFVSAIDPPPELAEQAAACENDGVWPVLAGEEGDRSEMLAAPLILEDHPRIAPESPGDLFDGGEIDQLLILNILAMSDAEREEMRASDPRAREILDRCLALGPEDLMALHGTIREFGPVDG